jgi:hypothetical protein
MSRFKFYLAKNPYTCQLPNMGYKKLRIQAKTKNELYLHYEELYEIAVSELKFANLKEDVLKQILDEVKSLLLQNQPNILIKKVIENGLERYYIDKLIHYNLVK